MTTVPDLDELRGGIEDRLVAKIEKRGTGPRATFQAGGWHQRAFADLGGERNGNRAMARRYLSLALVCLAIANRRARGDYG